MEFKFLFDVSRKPLRAKEVPKFTKHWYPSREL
jgi:hypothetical protein